MLRLPLRSALLAAVATCACSGPERVVIVYTPLDADLLAWVEGAYRRARPEVDLRLAPMTPEALLERLAAERTDPEADVVWGAPAWTLAAAAGAGLLSEVRPGWAEALDPERRDPGGRWVGTSIDPLVLAFDHEQLSRSRAPRDWIDLLHPRFAGEVLLPEPGATPAGSLLLGVRVAAARAQRRDEVDALDWFVRLDAQQSAYVSDEEELVLRLARGEGSVAPVRLSLVEAARARGRSVEYALPESGAPLLVRGAAVVAGSREPDEAAAFLEWLGGHDVARELALRFHLMPARPLPAADAPGWLASIRLVDPQVPSADTLAAHLDAWIARWRAEVRGRGTPVPLP